MGLDVGSDSCGWAATDTNFNLLRLKGNDAWGSRIFDAAKNADTRRLFRSSRRRSDRRKYRIFLLNSIFNEEIAKIDDTFFLRLNNSIFVNEDKDERVRNLSLLFKTKEKEKEFYDKFPTIWHLRKELLNPDSNAYKDLRNVYLAIHHIIKYRGNFLSDGKIEPKKTDYTIFSILNEEFNNILKRKISEEDYEEFEFIPKENYEHIYKTLENETLNVTERKKELSKLLNKNADISKYIDFFIAVVSGGSYDISKLSDSYEKMSVCFDNKFDEEQENIHSALGEDYNLVLIAKQISDFFKLKNLLRDEDYLSCAFASIYDSHKNQLIVLKKFCREVDTKYSLTGKESVYNTIFRRRDIVNYASFVGVETDISKVSIEDFNKDILKIFDKFNDVVDSNDVYKQLKYLCSRNEMLTTIAVASTSLIPHQLHENELIKILDNACKYYPFLEKEKDKIIKLFKFRVPYYFGPLNSQSNYSNAVRIKNETVTPWNFDEIFDFDKTRSNFMKRLTNNCTYLLAENVLPSNSIYYQKFNILNRINCLIINGNKIDNKIKVEVYKYLLSRKKTTPRGLSSFLKNIFGGPVTISGINSEEDFVSDSYCLFKEFFGVNELNDKQLEISEQIIFICTIYRDSFNDSIEYIKKELAGDLSKEQIRLLKSKTFVGWGRLSKKLLVNLKSVDESGVVWSILDVLENTTLNFNQIIAKNNEYQFAGLIEKENETALGKMTEDEAIDGILENLPATFRRSTIQALRIIDEITLIKGAAPKAIAIEVTREDDEKKKGKQTNSRYKELESFVSSLLKDTKDEFMKSQANNLKNELASFENNQVKLKSRHLYLYFKQNGVDLYTGKPIDINDVLNTNKYDIDHIVPRHLRPDNSLDNTVLVDREYNQKIKGGLYPIPEQIRCKPEIRSLWKYLNTIHAISDKKYNALIRATEISDEELCDFVNSQLNVVNQANKALKDILEIKYKDTKVIFSKAQYPAHLRHYFKIGKFRNLNDAHHAVDAYLNIVAGVTLYKEYSLDYILNKNKPISDESFDGNRTFNMEKRLVDVLENNNLSSVIIKNALKRDALVTYRPQYFDAEFYKTTIHKKGRNTLIPVHTSGPMSNTLIYGGYEELKTSYFLVGVIKEKKNKKVLVDVPVLYSKLYKNKEELKAKICEDQFPSINPEFVDLDFEHPIQPNTKVLYDKVPYLLCSKGSVSNLKIAYQLYVDNKHVLYLNFLCKDDRLKTLENFEGDSYEFILNREENNSVIASKKRNKEIFTELVRIGSQPYFKSCNVVQSIKTVTNFDELNLYQQVNTLLEIIKLFGRDARYSKITPNMFTKSKQSLLNEDIYLVNESVTGLFKSIRKL